MSFLLAATKLPLTTLLAIGALGALVIVAWSFSNWRSAVKAAFIIALIEGALRKWAFGASDIDPPWRADGGQPAEFKPRRAAAGYSLSA